MIKYYKGQRVEITDSTIMGYNRMHYQDGSWTVWNEEYLDRNLTDGFEIYLNEIEQL